jgi:hypothetical protein
VLIPASLALFADHVVIDNIIDYGIDHSFVSQA